MVFVVSSLIGIFIDSGHVADTDFGFPDLEDPGVSRGFELFYFDHFRASMYLPWGWKNIKRFKFMKHLRRNTPDEFTC